MSTGVLTTWGVVLEIGSSVGGDGAIDEASLRRQAADWFEAGRRAYFDRCPRLLACLEAQDAVLTVSREWIEPLRSVPTGGPARIAVSVTEVRPSSFDVALRIRRRDDAAEAPVNGRCTVAIERRATGQLIPVPGDVRDELIAIQLGARALC